MTPSIVFPPISFVRVMPLLTLNAKPFQLHSPGEALSFPLYSCLCLKFPSCRKELMTTEQISIFFVFKLISLP